MAQWREPLGCDLKNPCSKVSSAPILQHGFDKSLCVMGTQSVHQSTQMTDSNTSKFPSAWDKVFIKDRGSCPQRLKMNLLQCQHCLRFFTRHLSCVEVSGPKPGTLRRDRGSRCQSPRPCRKGRHCSLESYIKATFPSSGAPQSSSPDSLCTRLTTASHLCGRH